MITIYINVPDGPIRQVTSRRRGAEERSFAQAMSPKEAGRREWKQNRHSHKLAQA
jgi:hypothetical protein